VTDRQYFIELIEAVRPLFGLTMDEATEQTRRQPVMDFRHLVTVFVWRYRNWTTRRIAESYPTKFDRSALYNAASSFDALYETDAKYRELSDRAYIIMENV